MKTATKIRLGWKYRKFLWKYRGLIRHRKEIAAVVASGALIAAALWIKRADRE